MKKFAFVFVVLSSYWFWNLVDSSFLLAAILVLAAFAMVKQKRLVAIVLVFVSLYGSSFDKTNNY